MKRTLFGKIKEDKKIQYFKIAGNLKKFSKSGVFDTENGGRFIFELLWGVFFRQKLEKIDKIRNNWEKVG